MLTLTGRRMLGHTGRSPFLGHFHANGIDYRMGGGGHVKQWTRLSCWPVFWSTQPGSHAHVELASLQIILQSWFIRINHCIQGFHLNLESSKICSFHILYQTIDVSWKRKVIFTFNQCECENAFYPYGHCMCWVCVTYTRYTAMLVSLSDGSWTW